MHCLQMIYLIYQTKIFALFPNVGKAWPLKKTYKYPLAKLSTDWASHKIKNPKCQASTFWVPVENNIPDPMWLVKMQMH